MFNTNLVQLLKSFSAYEMNSFGKFIVSPFFNKNEKIISLYKILEKEHPKFIGAKLEKEKVYKKIYPLQKYDDKKMRYLTYELLKLSEEFLAQINFRKDTFMGSIHCLSELIDRKQVKLAEKKTEDAVKNLKLENYPDEVYYYNKHWLDVLTNYLDLSQQKRYKIDSLVQEGENIILLLFIVLLKLTYNLSLLELDLDLDVSVTNNIIYDFLSSLDIENLINKASKAGYKNIKKLELYYNMMLLHIEPDNEEPFRKLKDEFDFYTGILNKEDIYNLYTVLNTFCINKNLKGNIKYGMEQFELMKKALHYKAIMPLGTGYIHITDFRNFMSAGIREGQLEWAEDFINKHIDKVTPKDRESILNIYYASVNFEKKKYGEALENLSRIKTVNYFFKYDIKNLMLRIYYELNWIEPAIELMDSYKHFINNNKSVSLRRRKAGLNFINFTSKLFNIKNESRAFDVSDFKMEISSADPITNKKWLLEKIDELPKEEHRK